MGLALLVAIAAAVPPWPLAADESADKRWKEDDLVAAYHDLVAAGRLEAAVRSPSLPKEPPQPMFLEALAWYAAGTPRTPGVLDAAELDRKIDAEVKSYMQMLEAKVEKGAPNDYPRTRTWKLIQKYTLLENAMAKPEHARGYAYDAMALAKSEDAADWDREHTLQSADEVTAKVCRPSHDRPVVVKYGNTNCTQCMLFEIIGSVQSFADSPSHRGKVDVYKVWFGHEPDSSFAGRIRNPKRLDDLAKAEGVSSSPTFIVYRNGRRYPCGEGFPDEQGHDEHLESCLTPSFAADAPLASFCQSAGATGAGGATTPASSTAPAAQPSKLKIYGDVRLRGERDWSSTQSDGTERSDRARGRVRARLGFTYTYDEHLTFGARLRTGNSQDQQSPHQTLGDEFDTKGVNFDRVYLHGTWDWGWAWGGKNSFPFWAQNELFWDEDVTPEGLAAGTSYDVGNSAIRLKPAAGYFLIESSSSSNEFHDKAYMAAAQLAVEAPAGKKVDVSGAAGRFSFHDNPVTTDVALADLDSTIWVVGGRAVFKTDRPWSVGADFMRNTEDYPTTLFNRDEDTGYVFQASLGQLKQQKDWLVAYYWAHIEKFAVVARFAQDDWLRWGSATDTRSSNFEGHEIRLAYAFGPSWNTVLRFYDVEAIELESPTAVSLEDGTRARIDFNVAF
jgi:hypothetical protein